MSETDDLEATRRERLGTGIADNYDRTAERYEEAARLNASGSERLIASLPDARVERLLDIGCGTGFATMAAIRRFAPRRVTGIDVSAAMVARLGEHLAEHPEIEADLRVGDESGAELEPGAYDLALMAMTLHWIADRDGAIARMARAVAPGGHVGVLAPGPRHDGEYVDLVTSLDPPVPEVLYSGWALADITPDALSGYFQAAGIEPLDIWVESRIRVVPIERFMARVTTVGAHVWKAHLGEEELAAHMARIEDAVRAASGPEGFRYTFTKTFGVGRRRNS